MFVPKGPIHNKPINIGSYDGMVLIRWQAISQTSDDPILFTYTNMHYLALTHYGWDKMANIYQTTFSNAFSWMKMYTFQLRFH